MIPLLYDKTGNVKLGELTSCIECLVEEERNGLFEVSLIYPSNDTLFNSLEEENIIVCNANDTLLNQKFRIYMTRKLMSNRVEVFARHISFDLAYDYVDGIDIENQSCEYTLNTIFRNSQFSTHYKGYSDIINAQDYKISKVNCIEAIGGTKGSILDTFGTGAEILRDNTNIHVLNKRGHDNGVSIEYSKNLTGFELEEDYSELITRIIPFATYSDSETNEEVLVEANAVDSDLISNYSHPYISYIDFSEKFEDEEIPTTSKLTNLAKKYFKENECDKPKQNFKIEFVPLSKCVGYEGIQDNISLCDIVTIKDTRYNIDTKAKVIKTVFNVLKNKYESMELGEPRTTLGDIINSSSGGQDGEQGPPGPQGPPGKDGSIGDFPNSLPPTPVLSANVYGFASIELNWTYENKVYYNYELYGSKIKDFTPNEFDLIHAGQTSSYLFQAKPNETWYFRVCAVNTHGERTAFSSQVIVNTTKIDDLSNYVQNQAIDEALIGTLSLDRGWVGTLKGNYIDAKQLSVTDGNGKRTLDIDSYGNVNLNVNSLQISSNNVATENYANNQANTSLSNAKTYADNVGNSTLTSANTHANNVANTAQKNAINTAKDYTNTKITDVKAEIKMTTDSISQRVSSTESTLQTTTNKVDNLQVGGRNLLLNTKKGFVLSQGHTNAFAVSSYKSNVDSTGELTVSFDVFGDTKMHFDMYFVLPDGTILTKDSYLFPAFKIDEVGKVCKFKATGPANGIGDVAYIRVRQNTSVHGSSTHVGTLTISNMKLEVGNKATDYTVAPEDIDSSITSVDSKVATTNNKVASIETSLNGITQRVSSTESTVSTHTTQLGTVDARINNAKNDAISSAVGVKDTRNTNENPQWYTTNYPKRTVEEFKYANKIGIGSSSVYGVLTTVVPWADFSGGYPTQTFRSDSTATYTRKGISDTAWGAWTQVEDTAGSQAKATQALNDAKTFTTTEVAKTNNKVASIETNLNSITSRVSATETNLTTTTKKLDNLQVGGRNYVLSSNTEKSASGNTYVTYNISTKAQTELQGKVVTISFEAKKTSGTANMYAYLRSSGGPISPVSGTIGDITTSYKRYSVTFTAPSNLSSAVQIGIHSTNDVGLYVRNAKLEKGNMPTDWSPASEDMETTVSNLTTRVSNAESKLTKDSLTTTIGSHYTTSSDVNGIVTSKGYATTSQVQQTKNELTATFKESGGYNRIYNGAFLTGNTSYWSAWGSCSTAIEGSTLTGLGKCILITTTAINQGLQQVVSGLVTGKKYILSALVKSNAGKGGIQVNNNGSFVSSYTSSTGTYQKLSVTFTASTTSVTVYIGALGESAVGNYYFAGVMLTEGTLDNPWSPHPSEIYEGITKIDKNGITVTQSNAKTKTTMSADGFAITRTDKNADIFKVGSNGLLTLNGVFKCYKDNVNMTGARLETSGAIMNGYNSTGGSNPVFASGLWTDENMGYFSVGYTRADASDENGCLWMSPQQGNNGCRLTFSILKNSVRKTTNLFFQKDGSLMFYTDINGLNATDDRYTYQFDSGVSTRSLRCDNLRTYNIYPRYTGSNDIGSASMRFKDIFGDSLCTTNNQLRLGTVTSTGAWETYGALDVNSKEGYVFPDKGNGQLSLGTSNKRFHTIFLVNSPNVSSDKRVKTDIHYLDELVEETNIIDSEVPRVERNMNITTQDMYDFIKDDLKLASYRYNVNLERGNTSTDYGFIAQDILYTKVGSEIVQLEDKTDLNSNLSYNQGNYIATLAGALQEAIKKIEILENKIKELESK